MLLSESQLRVADITLVAETKSLDEMTRGHVEKQNRSGLGTRTTLKVRE